MSKESLGQIQHRDDLLDMVVSLNQQFVERSGFFPMSGELQGISTAAMQGNLQLHRMDAKVRFWVKVGSDAIKNFELDKWQVFNVPADSYLMGREVRERYGKSAADSGVEYFNTVTRNFEDEEIVDGKSQYGFSFYLLENALVPKKTPLEYAHREKQVKDAQGLNGEWEYANDNSTYVVLTGRLVMDTDYQYSQEEIKKGCTLSAVVRYVIHLGDFTNLIVMPIMLPML